MAQDSPMQDSTPNTKHETGNKLLSVSIVTAFASEGEKEVDGQRRGRGKHDGLENAPEKAGFQRRRLRF